MKPIAWLVGLVISGALSQQEPPNPKALYEAGHYAQALEVIGSQTDATSQETVYLAGQVHLRLNQADGARDQFAKLSAGVPVEEPTAWSLVGQSAIAQLDGNNSLAIELGRRAVGLEPGHFHPHYQLGLAYSAAEQWETAAEAFDKAATVDPAFAYAHYYAGLAYSKVRQVSRMATHFEYFLKLAPEAPERSAVQTLMRRVR